MSGCKKNCDKWYELENKECVEIREVFYGTYLGSAVTSDGQIAPDLNMTISSYSGNIQRLSCEESGVSFYLELTGENMFDIHSQDVYSNGHTGQIEGFGTFNGTQVTMDYSVTFPGDTIQLIFTGTK